MKERLPLSKQKSKKEMKSQKIKIIQKDLDKRYKR